MENLDDYIDEADYYMQISGSDADPDDDFSDAMSDFEEGQANANNGNKLRTAIPYDEVQTFDFIPSMHKNQNRDSEQKHDKLGQQDKYQPSKYKQPIKKIRQFEPTQDSDNDDFENTESIITTPIIHEEARKRYPGNPMATTNENQERIQKMYSDSDLCQFLRSKIPISSGQPTIQSEGSRTEDELEAIAIKRQGEELSEQSGSSTKQTQKDKTNKSFSLGDFLVSLVLAFKAFRTGLFNINWRDLKKSLNGQVFYMNLSFMILMFFLVGRVSSFSDNFLTLILGIFFFFLIFLSQQVWSNYQYLQSKRALKKRDLGDLLARPRKPPDKTSTMTINSNHSSFDDEISSIIPEVPNKGIKNLTPPGSVRKKIKSRKFKIEKIQISEARIDLIDDRPHLQVTLPDGKT
jgi:hypothetical protein